jgi:hypothetical protein
VFPEGLFRFIRLSADRLILICLFKTHSGKTSLIHSLAGELGLDIYVVSLSSKGYELSFLLSSLDLIFACAF